MTQMSDITATAYEDAGDHETVAWLRDQLNEIEQWRIDLSRHSSFIQDATLDRLDEHRQWLLKQLDALETVRFAQRS